jgi:hypothetical protein
MDKLTRNSRNSGIALVTVLGITVVVMALISVLVGLSVRSSRITASDVTATSLAQLADGWSEVGRIAVTNNFQESKLQLNGWLNLLATNRSTTPVINPTNVKVSALAGVKSADIDGTTVRWKLAGVSTTTDANAWVMVAATAVDDKGRSQTVTRKIQFAGNSIFELAILTETVNCMFCHLRVNGDVGSIGFFRPGWGTEGSSGQNSGNSSSINGELFVNSTVSADGSGTTANGATISGTRNTNYSGEKLPRDEAGNTTFPGLDRQAAADTAAGTLEGGVIKGVATNGSFSSATTLTTISNKYDGNLVLTGTDANPIVIDGDVYVSGDVVIKGVVKGRGAIYAGRNTYVAGNLVNKNRADKPGVTGGVCAAITDVNACAKANIAAGKDELRLSAGNNVVMGDFTETQGGPTTKAGRQNLQSGDYFRSQFGLSNTARYVRKGTSEELRKSGTKYYDQLNREVPAADVKSFAAADAYNGLITPGATKTDGTFGRWMSDAEYQSVLGTESLPYNTWRTDISKSQFPGTAAQSKAAIALELQKAGLPVASNADTISLADRIYNNSKGSVNYSGTDANNQTVSGTAYYDSGSIRVAVNEARSYKTETTALDAFLYANNRIAGKLSPRGGFVNGGMIAREIGVLAPGKNNGADWWIKNGTNGIQSTTTRDKYNKCDTATRPTDSSADAHKSGTDCDYAINYDYRLRNGGYGYNLYKGKTGTTSEWKLDLDGSKKVNP